MMRKLLVGCFICVAILMTSCSSLFGESSITFTTNDPTATESTTAIATPILTVADVTTPITTVATEAVETTPISPPTPIVIKTKADLLTLTSDIVYPVDVQFNGAAEGISYDSWFNNDITPVLGHNAGDHLAIEVYNSSDEPEVYQVQYQDIVGSQDYYSITGQTYQAAPAGASSWVTFTFAKETLSPHELAKIPFSLKIPSGIKVPSQWEFDIVVKNISQTTMVQSAYLVKVLVTMAQ